MLKISETKSWEPPKIFAKGMNSRSSKFKTLTNKAYIRNRKPLTPSKDGRNFCSKLSIDQDLDGTDKNNSTVNVQQNDSNIQSNGNFN